MRRIALVLTLAIGMILATIGTASAHAGGPCDDYADPGNSGYARHHIVNATPGHVPGTHQGFSLCLGVHG